MRTCGDETVSVMTGGRPGRCRRPNPVPRTPGRRAFLLAVALTAILVPPVLLALPHARSVEAPWIPAFIGHPPGRGMFLVAAPALRDPNFARTVVLLLEYDETGALGLVINRPTEASLHDVLVTPLPNSEGHTVFAGGPVELRRLIALLRSPVAVDGAERLFGDVHASGSMDTLRRALERDGHATDVHAYLGYAGWSPGQLDAEVSRGDWIVTPADAESIFDTPPGDVWRNLMRRNAGRWVRAGDVSPA